MSSPIAEEEGEMPEPHRAENINRKLLRSASSMSEDQIRAVSEEVAMTLVSRMVAHEQRLRKNDETLAFGPSIHDPLWYAGKVRTSRAAKNEGVCSRF